MTSHDHRWVVTIDGPGAAGKTTVAQALADRLGARLFDTGTLYRALTLAALRAGIEPTDAGRLAALAHDRVIDVTLPSITDGRLADVRLDGDDVTWAIREPDVDATVSAVSAHPAVRDALLPVQRRIAAGGPIVIVGRDIGTVVVPDAGVKIFLDASLTERARRRHRELHARGTETSLAEVLADLEARDRYDAGRVVAPLRPASDAVVINSDGKDIDAVSDEIGEVIREIWAGFGTALPTVEPPR